MLQKQYRLPKEDVYSVLRYGKRVGTSPLIYTHRVNHSNIKRYAILVSAKSTKLATDRNRIKRLVREAIKKYIELAKPGHDVVFRWTGSIKEASYDVVCDLVIKAFKSI